MSLSVGELVAYLRLDASNFYAGIGRAQSIIDELDGRTADVNVEAHTAAAETELAAVAVAEDRVDEGNRNIASSGQQAGKGMGALVAAALLLGPALVPIAAGAAGLAVGLGAMGAAGVLAIVSIVSEMKKGTALGGQYSVMLGGLKSDLATLEKTAATGVLGPFQQAVADLQTKMPALNAVIGEFSTITGKTAGALVTGLIAAMISLAPLARDASGYIETLTQRFVTAMSGPGVVAFGDYVRSVFPQAMQAVESIVGAVFHLVAAIAPLGMGSLGILRMLTDVINAIPTDHLATLVQVASAVFIAFKAFGLLSAGITAVGAALKIVGASGTTVASVGPALQAIGISAETAATGVRALTIAAGVIGAILGVATLVYSAFADSQRQNTQAANDFADALRTSNGVIDESVRQMAAKKLSDLDALSAARQLGLSLSTVTDAALGNADAMAKVNAVVKAAKDAYMFGVQGADTLTPAMLKNNDAANILTPALDGTNSALKDGAQKYKDLAAATASSTPTITAAATAQDALAAKVGTTAAALALAATAQQATATAADNAKAKMYLENDAAGLLKTGLDLLNGKAISAADAQNSFDSSLVGMSSNLNKAGKQIPFTTASIGDMSAASVTLRGQLNSQVTNLQNVVEANGGLADSTGKAREQMVTMRQQIIDNAVAHGVDKDAVTAYIDKLLAIPPSVTPTKLDVDKAAADAKITVLQARIDAIKQGNVPGLSANSQAAQDVIAGLQAQIDSMHGASVAISVNTTAASAQLNNFLASVGGRTIPFQFVGTPVPHAAGGLIGRAAGGLLAGPGTGTSDSITGVNASGVPIARVSTGEFVVNAAATARNRVLLDAINSGQQGGGGGQGGGPALQITVQGNVVGDTTVRDLRDEFTWAMVGSGIR
jgi:hypothetical protein